MKPSETLGLIFTNNSNRLNGLTNHRTIGSIPFGGRYRLIDFPLSNMVNAGISSVAVIIKSNYQSLIDHLESGKTWDLARKRGGLKIFPPFSYNNDTSNSSKVESVYNIKDYLTGCTEKYCVITDCSVVNNLDIKAMLDTHIKSGADITFATANGPYPKNRDDCMVMEVNGDRIENIVITPKVMPENSVYCLNTYIINRELLIDLVLDAISKNSNANFNRDIFQPNTKRLDMRSYVTPGNSFAIIDVNDYVAANMALLDSQVRNELFCKERPIYTKVRDEMPVKYGIGAKVTNSLIADGCIIEGEVVNSIIFRGVKVGKNARIENSIIMQSTAIGENCNLSNIVCDKNVTISANRSYIGSETCPVFIPKGSEA